MSDRSYSAAVEAYAEWGVDVPAALDALRAFSISIHCWQADDVGGFEHTGAALTGGGIQATGNFPGKARTVDEARADYEKALSLLPGRHRINLHASYGEFDGQVDRDAIEPKHFEGWIAWAKEARVQLDFNCTCFAHPKADEGFTLSSKDPAIRSFWIEHVDRSRWIASTMGRAQVSPCIHNLWIPDGAKDFTVDRMGHRHQLAESLDECYRTYYVEGLKDAVESKLFGIGSEFFVAGSHEFYLGYIMSRRRGIMPCFDMGHFHPTESVADKLSAVLQFQDEVLLHCSRPVRWDSDHVPVLDDALRDVASEAVRCGEDKDIHVALDFFDASINRVGAYVIGTRAVQQAFLTGLLEPRALLLEAEESGNGFKKLALLEQCKAMPFGAVWDRFCEEEGVPPGGRWIDDVMRYERDVLRKRDA